ncbi:MAG: OadG family protein [Clostridia bacterium]|nr:OadG family protein [Clostridia bacterium]MBR3873445.1 OadG family protein [Clostridia bacterium]
MMKWFSMLSEAAAEITATAAPELIETVEPAAEAVANSALVTLPLFTKGLLTTLMGLLGVFLVLTLFFITIKLMQKIQPRNKD